MEDNRRPKHLIIRDWILERIASEDYQTGQQIPTENELSQQFSVSRQTVRQAIGALESDGYLARTRGSGTYVQRKEAPMPGTSNKTRRVGVITTYLDDYIFPSIIHGVEEVLTEHGYLFTLGLTYNNSLSERKALQKLLSDPVAGVIIEGTKSALPSPNAALLEQLRSRGIPLVFINGTYKDTDDSYVIMDDVKSGELLTELLAHKRHQCIGGIFKSDDMQGIKRYEGFVSGAQRLGLTIDDNAVFWYTTEDLSDLFDGPMDAAILRRLSNVSAVICYNDEIAVKLIKMLHRHHKSVPADLSIASFDNSPLADSLLYNLTSVTYPAREVGRTAANLLLRCMDKPSNHEYIKLDPSVVERDSVAEQ